MTRDETGTSDVARARGRTLAVHDRGLSAGCRPTFGSDAAIQQFGKRRPRVASCTARPDLAGAGPHFHSSRWESHRFAWRSAHGVP